LLKQDNKKRSTKELPVFVFKMADCVISTTICLSINALINEFAVGVLTFKACSRSVAYNRLTIQQVQGEACGGSALAHCQHRLLYFGTECQNLPEDLSSFGCGLSHSIEKKPHPMDQVITVSHLRQGIIIAGAVTFNEIR
jgi:hypothetical protein